MSAAACKMILDSDTMAAMGRTAADSKAVAKVIEDAPEVWAIGTACASLMGKIDAVLRKEGGQ